METTVASTTWSNSFSQRRAIASVSFGDSRFGTMKFIYLARSRASVSQSKLIDSKVELRDVLPVLDATMGLKCEIEEIGHGSLLSGISSLGDQSVQLLVERFGGFVERRVLLNNHERRRTHVGDCRARSAPLLGHQNLHGSE